MNIRLKVGHRKQWGFVGCITQGVWSTWNWFGMALDIKEKASLAGMSPPHPCRLTMPGSPYSDGQSVWSQHGRLDRDTGGITVDFHLEHRDRRRKHGRMVHAPTAIGVTLQDPPDEGSTAAGSG